MPFITNDFNSMVVDDDDYANYPEKYKYYVVARRLFLRHEDPYFEEYLLKRFSKYGPIESAKVLRTGTEGFVTFKSDRHAFLAYNAEKYADPDTRITVDSTWHQPDEAMYLNCESEWSDKSVDVRKETAMVSDEPELPLELLRQDDYSSFNLFDYRCDEVIGPSPLLRLDDYSLLSLFDRCDQMTLVNLSETCRRLKKLLTYVNYSFRPHKLFRYSFHQAMVDVESIFRLMGHRFDELHLWFGEYDSKDTIFSFIQLVLNYCSYEKIQKMTFGMYSWENETWERLRPILRHLTTLRLAIENYDDEDITVDFMELCPNLRTLISWDVFIVDKCLGTSRPSLKSFCWKRSWTDFMYEVVSLKFFEENRQITHFECRDFHFEYLVPTVQLLPNIETLTLYEPPSGDFTAEEILSLKRFKKLSKLTLGMADISNTDDPLSVMETCGKLKCLSELFLYFTLVDKDIDKARLTRISTTLHQLRHLARLDLYCVQLNEEAVFNFVLSAIKTKTIHLHECNVYATESLLTQLGTVSHRWYLNGFRLFTSNNKHNKLVTINGGRVVCIDWICHHRFRPND